MAFPDALAWEQPKLYSHQMARLSCQHEFPFSSPAPVAVAAVANWEFSAVGPRLRELCVKLMFLHPVDYGRKAEELLWRKVYYEVIQLIKTNKKAGICSPGWAVGESTVKLPVPGEAVVCSQGRTLGAPEAQSQSCCMRLSCCGQKSFNELL